MNQRKLIIRYVCLLLLIHTSGAALAQNDTTHVPASDTLEIGGITVIRDNAPPPAEPKKGWLKRFNTRVNPHRVETNWALLDLGFSNYADRTNYATDEAQHYAGPGGMQSWFKLKNFKSVNINVWVVTQKVNLVQHYVNLKYALGLELNNYRYTQPIRYQAVATVPPGTPLVQLDPAAAAATSPRIYEKNKLAADYITAPLMLNFNFTPHNLYQFGLSAGISAGYLYAARNKTITSDEGKKKTKDDFELRTWKLSYVGELQLGVVTLYGSYAFKSMYKRGLNMFPYTIGIRLSPKNMFEKLNLNK